MWGLFKRKRAERASTPEAIAVVEAPVTEAPDPPGMKVGRRDWAWRLLARYAIEGDDAPAPALTASGYAVYMDLTAWVRRPPRRKRSAELPDTDVAITLPKARLMGLTLGLLNLSEPQLQKLGWSREDRTALTNPLIASTGGAGDFQSAPDFMRPTLRRSSWIRILEVLDVWRPNSPKQAELRSTLRAIIGAELDRAAAA